MRLICTQDCPQRDERLGWTGDIQIFAPTASFLYNTAGMLTGWLQDLAAEQLKDNNGVPPLVCPNVIQNSFPEEQAAVSVYRHAISLFVYAN